MRRLALVALLGLVACHNERPPEPSRVEASDASALPSAETPEAGVVEVVSFPLPVSPPQCGRTNAALEKAILDAPPFEGPPVTSAKWDHATPPARLDRVAKRFALRPSEQAILTREGFVVADRLAFDSYAFALHELHQSQLPIYVSVDPIFHAIFVSHDELLERWELARVQPALERVLAGLTRGLRDAKGDYPPEVIDDVTTYVDVARALLGVAPAKPGSEAARLAEKATKAASLEEVTLFGRSRMIDFSQYAPRGHYAKTERLQRFFRTAMWLSRLEWNLVSRSSRSSQPGVTPNPDETPREAVGALALADIAQRASVLGDVGSIDRGWGTLAGVREDVPLGELARIRAKLPAGPITIADAFPVMKSEIGDRFERTARLHYMPEGSSRLPAIATMLGPRVVPDVAATRPLVHGELTDRYDLTASDIAYMLGHDRAKAHLAADRARFPALDGALDRARAIALAPHASKDLYGSWMEAVEALAITPPRGTATTPSFTETDAFRDLRIDETVAAFGQIKHNHVLVVGQPYDEGACVVPDGFVDPAVGAWDALARFADRGAAAFAELDPKDATGGAAYFRRVEKIVRVLRAMAAQELTGRPLTPDMLAFLSNVVEIHAEDIGTGFTTSYDGWYFDLFLTRPEATTAAPPGRPEHAAMKYAGFIADYYTSVNSGNVAYVGAKEPRLGVFVVDTGGPPRVVVGPVASAFEHHAPLDKRLKDSDVRKLAGTSAPWAASYLAPAPGKSPLRVSWSYVGDSVDEPNSGKSSPVEVTVSSKEAVGPVTVALYDHHREITAEKTVELRNGVAVVRFPSHAQRVAKGTHATEMIGISAADFRSTIDTTR